MPMFVLLLTLSLYQESGVKQARYVKSHPHVADLLPARWAEHRTASLSGSRPSHLCPLQDWASQGEFPT